METPTHLPSTRPADERAGGGVLFFGLAIPYMLGALMICAGLVVGGTIGLLVAYLSFVLLLFGVAFGIWSFISTDDDH
jgi:hypothetical protein